MLPAQWEKRFARDMATRSHYRTVDLTDRQRAQLWRLVRRYRRQMPPHIASLAPE
jgi:Spy/CpxP family protein refolding chaperone